MERRRYYRLTKTADLQCRDLGSRTAFHLTTKDISIHGVRFVTPKSGSPALRKGDMLSIRLSLIPEIPFTEVTGKIVWLTTSENEYEGGIEFLNLTGDQLQPIMQAIEKLKTGETFPVPAAP